MTYIRLIILTVLLTLGTSRLLAQDESEEINLDSLKALTKEKRSDKDMLELYYDMAYKVLDYDLDFAQECCNNAIKLSRKLHELLYEANTYRCLSKIYEYNDELDSSLNCNFRALQIIASLQSTEDSDSLRHLQSRCFNSIGSLFANSGQFSEAVDYFHKALKDIDSLVMPDIYSNLGLISGMNKVYDVALDHFEQAKRIAKKMNDSAAVDNANFLMATVYIDIYENNKDVSSLMIAVKLADELSELKGLDIYNLMNFSVVLPQIYIDAYNYYLDYEGEKKEEYLNMARKFNEEGLSHDIELYKDQLLSTKVKILVAEEDYTHAAKILKQIEDPSAYLECAPKYYLAIHDYERAFQVLEQANREEHQGFSLEYTVKSEKLFAQQQYEDKLTQMDKDKKMNDMKFEEMTFIRRLSNIFMAVVSVVGFILVIYIVNHLIKINMDNKLLEMQNKTIASRNAELMEIREKIQAQYDEIANQSNIIKSQKDDLSEINRYLLASIKYAAKIQKAAVPAVDAVKNMLHDVFIYWQPLEIVSGDFYWAMESNGIKYLIVADCTGHGVPGALVSILGISLLNDISAHIHDIHDPADFLNKFKGKFLNSINNNIEDGMDLAMMVIDSKNKKMMYSGAKRPLIQVRGGEVREFSPDKICIGHNYLRENVKFTFQTIDIQEGDMYYAFSDGISDQFGGPHCTKFTLKRLKELLGRISTDSVEQQQSVINTAIHGWMNSEKPFKQLDDQLIIGFRI